MTKSFYVLFIWYCYCRQNKQKMFLECYIKDNLLTLKKRCGDFKRTRHNEVKIVTRTL